jgi:hypothetical protein
MASTKKADALFSKAVRSRGKCEMAGLFPKIKCNGVLQCAHIISRRYRAIRWDESNAFCACAAHHLYQTHHPLEFETEMEQRWPNLWWDLRQSALQLAPMDAAAVIARLSEDREEA